MSWLLLCALAAHADTVQELADELQQVTGRRMYDLPRVHWSDATPDDARGGQYNPGTRDITMYRTVIAEQGKALLMSSQMVDHLTRCVLAHELVHALQDQWVVWPTDKPAAEVFHVLQEGQANVLAEKVCAPSGAVQLALRALQGLDTAWQGERDPDGPWAYAVGQRIMAEYGTAYGLKATWWLLAHPPNVDLDAVARPPQAEVWQSARGLSDASRILYTAPTTRPPEDAELMVRWEPARAVELLPGMANRGFHEGFSPLSDAAWSGDLTSPGSPEKHVVVASMRNPEHSLDIITGRTRAALKFVADPDRYDWVRCHNFFLGPDWATIEDSSVGPGVVVSWGRDEDLVVEAFTQVEGVLTWACIHGKAEPGHLKRTRREMTYAVQKALQAIAGSPLSHIPQRGIDTGFLRTHAPPTLPRPQPSWHYRMRQAAAYADRDPQQCSALLQRAAKFADPVPSVLAEVGQLCANAAEQHELRAWWFEAAGGWSKAPESMVFYESMAMRNLGTAAEQRAASVALRERSAPPSKEGRAFVALAAAILTGTPSEVLEASRNPALPETVRGELQLQPR